MNKTNTFAKSILAISLSTLMIGCGGGGSSSPAATTPSKVGGTAAKGIVQQGIVKAYMLTTTGVAGSTAVGNAITNNDGTYSLELSSDYDGTSALLLELTSDDATTKMVCDALNGCGTTARGGLLTPPAGFKLNTIIPAVSSSSTVDAQITPFTHIAAKSIQNSGDSSSSNIAATTSKINQLVGTNILKTVPVNINDSAALSGADANQQRYTVMLAALAEQAFKDNNLVDNLEAFANDFSADGDFGDTGGLVVNDFLAAANAEVTNSAADLNDAVEASLTQHTTIIAAQTNTNGEFQPTETTGTGESDVAKAKSLITEVRTWKDSLANLENPADAFAVETDVIIDTLDADSNAVIEVLGRVVSAVQSTIDNAIDNDTDVPTSVTVTNRDGQTMGIISLTDASTASSEEFTVSSSDIAGVSLNAMIKLNESTSNTNISAGDKTLEVSAEASNADTKVTFENTVVTINLAEDYLLEDENPEEPSISALSFKGGLKVEELNSGVATGKSAMGNAEIKLVALNGLKSINDDLNLSLEKIALSDLTVSSDSGSTAGLSISLEMDNATNFDTFGYLNNESTIQLHEDVDLIDFDVSDIKADFNISTIDFLFYSISQDQICVQGPNINAEEAYVNYTCQPGDISELKQQSLDFLNSEYPQNYTTVVFEDIRTLGNPDSLHIHADLTVADMETATSFLDATLNVTGSLDLASHPEAILTLTADKTGIDEGSFTATLGYDGKSMQILANTTNGTDTGTSGDLTFTNADGVVMKLNASSGAAVSGVVTVDGVEVGTIEESGSGIVLIRYNDGTFESL